MSRHRARQRLDSTGRVLLVALVVACVALVFGPLTPARASGSVTKARTVARYYVGADGKKTTVDKRTVTLTVDQTTDLRSLQLVHVSWSGARATAGIVGDQNSDLARNEEYSMVLLECRGVDSTSVPAAQRISPQTCWTQYANERFYYGYDSFPAWRSDAAATRTDRAAFVNAPKAADLPVDCKNALIGTANQRWLPFVAADGQSFAGGISGCAGQPPEASPDNFSSLSLPTNETFGVTRLDGKGETDFDVFTGEDHNSLGCSQTVACSLVAIPIMGINCDSTGSLLPAAQRPSGDDVLDAQANCETAGNFTAGKSMPPQESGADAVDGRLWWSASNWNNRITVPLTFAPPDNACGLANTSTPLNVYGSELMIQATNQWAPTFCLNKSLFNFNHVQTPEPLAANLVDNGSIEAAFVSRPPDGGFTGPTVTAPVALTGFGIAFTVDDVNGNPVANLKLDARLLAKLLTQSYPDVPLIRDTHTYNDKPDLANNPLNITMDPEFKALNPNIPQRIKDSAATLLTVSSDSDVMFALTSYLNADADARAWLDGDPDPWGMTVNPRYRRIGLPVANWPLRDDFKPAFSLATNACLYVNPLPYLPLVAAPTARLFSIGQDMQFSIAQSQTVCVTPSPDPSSMAGAKLVAQGRQQAGARFMLGVVSLGDAAREGLHLAALETQKSADAADKFTDAAGRSFTGPTTTSLRAAAKLLQPDPSAKNWSLPYSTLRSDGGADAYPGTMVVYAAVPTSGLPAQDAREYATFLRFAANALQRPGTGLGKLPAGYLPMTSANGLGAQAYYTLVAADAVAAQQGKVPALTDKLPPNLPSGSPSGGSSATPGAPSTPIGGGGSPLVPGRGPTTSGSASTSTSPSVSGPLSTPAAQPVGNTQSLRAGGGALAIPLLAGLVVIGGAVAASARLRRRAGGHT